MLDGCGPSDEGDCQTKSDIPPFTILQGLGILLTLDKGRSYNSRKVIFAGSWALLKTTL
jgi:hypothetical protein